jgi:ABC-2 type transport system ATP-binding protein
MEATIEVRGLRKRYGRTVAVDGLSFTVSPGEVTGFVGPSSAGKSATLRMILGLDAPDEGLALVAGRPYGALVSPLREVGALLDVDAPHPHRTVRNHLSWIAHSNRIPLRRVDEVLDQVGLGAVGRKRPGGFPLGRRQRLGIAAALLGDPPILLLDEPVEGLGAEGLRCVRGSLRALAAEGRAVLVASQLMGELEGLATHLVVIGRGRLLADTTVDDLLTTASKGRVALGIEARADAMRVLAEAGATATTGERGRLIVEGLPAERIVELLDRRGLAFSDVAPHRPTLEEAYMELTRAAVDA